MRYWNYDIDGPAPTPTYGVSRELKKEVSEEIGDLLVDVARLAGFMEAEKKMGGLADPCFQKWFSTVENKADTLSDLVKEIHGMLQTSEDSPLLNPLKAVKTMSPRFDKA